MGISNHPTDLLSEILDLKRQIREMRRGTLSNAVISSGNLEARAPDGAATLKVGQIPYNGQIVSGIATYRLDGTLQRIEWDNEAGDGGWAMFDGAGNTVVADDGASGQGLATPWMGLRATPMPAITTPSQSTVSATFAALWRVHGPKQQPKVQVQVLTKVDAGTTGEVRLTVAGASIGDVVGLPSGDYSYHFVEGTVGGVHMSPLYVDVEARRVSGAGTVRVEVTSVVGRQS